MCLGPGDAGFPPTLRDLAPCLWLRGRVEALSCTPRVTVVGSRAASARGLARARALGRALAAHGALVISGGAMGIDAAAHGGALEAVGGAGGRTCAVLGTGVDIVYPVGHSELYAAILERGCLLSMLPPGTPARALHFPQRNELMAALADLVVVVEAQLRSGTSYTARAARRRGRKVVCFSDSPGTAMLLRTGAEPVSNIDEILTRLGFAGGGPKGSEQQEREDVPPLPVHGAQLLAALSPEPLDLGELCARAGLSAADCAAAVIELELRGQCSRLPGGRYIGHAPPC